MTVEVSADSRSLASLHSPRNCVSEPTAAVPDGSDLPASATPASTWLSTAWSICSPEKSPYRTTRRSAGAHGVGQGDGGAAAAEVE